MDALGFLGNGNSASWKEEVLLHDGSKIIVERSQTFGGYPTVESQERAVLTEEWVFPVPGSDQKVIWNVDFQRPPKGSQLTLLLLGFLDRTPYIVTKPAGCIAYNFWKRPNPPYVFFKYASKEWQQIPLAEFPVEFTEANVVIGGRSKPEKQNGDTLSIDNVREKNHGLEYHLLQIIREPIKVAQTTDCGEMIHDGNGGWIGIGWFKNQPSYSACIQYCAQNKIAPQYCPCETLFKGRK